jgi:hypothetical protein
MPVTFYPHEDDLKTSSIQEKIEVLMEAAERYKAIVLEQKAVAAPAAPAAPAASPEGGAPARKRVAPRDIVASFNWEEIARLLREIRELPEANHANKLSKSDQLVKLAEIYEVLRAAKMPKLEAVRLALMNEANQLRGSTQVA